MDSKPPANAFQFLAALVWDGRRRWIAAALVLPVIAVFAVWSSMSPRIQEGVVDYFFQEDREVRNEELVIQALKTAEGGDCPDSLFHPQLRAACIERAELIRQVFRQNGSANSAQFIGTENNTMYGRVEVYRVKFDKGVMTWWASLGPDGKFTTLAVP